MYLTKHAKIRMQQRVIPFRIVRLLNKLGRSTIRNGVEKRYFDKRSRRRVAKREGMGAVIRSRPNLLDTYLVKIDDRVVTVGYRRKRIQH